MRYSTAREVVRLGALLALITFPLAAQDLVIWGSGDEVQAGVEGEITGNVTTVRPEAMLFEMAPAGTAAGEVTIRVDEGLTLFGARTEQGAMTFVRGRAGISSLERGDMVRVRGIGSGRGLLTANEVIVVGGRGRIDSALGSFEVRGVIEGILAAEERLIVRGADGRRFTVSGSPLTPVVHEGQTFRIRHLRVGDTVRVVGENVVGDDVQADRIEVIETPTGAGIEERLPADSDRGRPSAAITTPGSSGVVPPAAGVFESIVVYGQLDRRVGPRGRVSFRQDEGPTLDLVADPAILVRDPAGTCVRLGDIDAATPLTVRGIRLPGGEFVVQTIEMR